MVVKKITLEFVSNDKDAFRIERLIRSAAANIIEENGVKGIKVNSEIEFVNSEKVHEVKIPRFIEK